MNNNPIGWIILILMSMISISLYLAAGISGDETIKVKADISMMLGLIIFMLTIILEALSEKDNKKTEDNTNAK